MEEKATVRELIDVIKKEGVEEAKKKSDEILAEGQKKAEDIVKAAKKEAEAIVARAREEGDRFRETGEKALVQAGRNLFISVRQEIIGLFQKITEKEVTATLAPEVIKEMVLRILEKWDMKGDFPGVEVLLSESDRKKLEDSLFQSLKDEWKKGVTLKPVESLQSGFQIGEKDGNVHYNFTEKGLAEILSEYLNPQLSKFLESSAREDK